MKRSLMSILLAIFLLSLFSGCKRITANYPQTKRKYIATQRIYPNELLRTSNYIVTNKEEVVNWFNSDQFTANLAEKKTAWPSYAQELYETKYLARKVMQVQMLKEVKAKKSAFYALYYRINSGININFQKGSLILTFRDPQGNTIDVPDKGCLFVYYKGTKAILRDSSKSNVQFNCTFNDEPDYSNRGNLVCVRVPLKYENWELVALNQEPQKISMLQ